VNRAETFRKAGEKESLNDNQGQRIGGHEEEGTAKSPGRSIASALRASGKGLKEKYGWGT